MQFPSVSLLTDLRLRGARVEFIHLRSQSTHLTQSKDKRLERKKKERKEEKRSGKERTTIEERMAQWICCRSLVFLVAAAAAAAVAISLDEKASECLSVKRWERERIVRHHLCH